jgi:hypothetical protein
MLLLAIVGLVAMAWVAVKVVELILRALVLDPQNKALWVAGGSVALSATLVLVTAGQSPALNAFAFASGAALLLVAKIIEIKHELLFLQPFNGDSFTQALLHEPWWSLETPVSANGHLQPTVAAHG